MKGKKLMKKYFKSVTSVLISMIMILSTIILPANAADSKPKMQKWTYKIGIKISNSRNSASTNGAIKFNVYSNDGTKLGTVDVPNVNKKNRETSATITLTDAPWTIGKYGLQNTSTDGLKVDYYRVVYKRAESNDSDYEYASEQYIPSGRNAGWIDTQKDEAEVSEAIVSALNTRELSSSGNFGELTDTLYLDGSETGTVSYEYDGIVSDTFSKPLGTGYYAMDCSDAPMIKLSGRCEWSDGTVDQYNGIKANGIEEIVKTTAFGDRVMGVKLDKGKLNNYMKKHGANMLKITMSYYMVKDGACQNVFEYAEIILIRKAFALEDFTLSNTGTDSKYGGAHYYNSASKSINATIAVKTGSGNNHLNTYHFNGAELKFDSIKLKLGDTDKTIDAESKSFTLDKYGRFNVSFKMQNGLDSNDVGVTVIMKNGRLKPMGANDNVYLLYDDKNSKQTPGDCERFFSSRKVDSITPKVTLTAVDGKINEWHKKLALTSVADENINTSNTQNAYLYKLYDSSGNPLTSAYYIVPAAKDMSTNITLRLNRAVEGIYSMRLEGTDTAGNSLSQTLENIKLDNKAPEVTVNTADKERLPDGTMNIKVPFTLSDASGTGKIYYCFVEGNGKAPDFDENSEMNKTSGTFDSVFGKWAYIDQDPSVIQTSATAMIKVASGMKFDGRVYWFAEDKFQNRTAQSFREISADNENTEASIDVSGICDLPLKDYDISITTLDVNKVYYRWRYPDGKYIAAERLYTKGDKEIGSGTQKTDSGNEVILNGKYKLVCRIVTPSGNSASISQDFAFDNEAPELRVSPKSGTAFRRTHEFTVKATDESGIVSAYGKFVAPNGDDIEGQNEFEIPVTGGAVNHTVVLSDAANGAYSLKVRVTDYNGYTTEKVSSCVYLVTEAAKLTEEIVTDKEYGSLPITSGKYTIKLTAEMPFANAESLKEAPNMYYRTADSTGAYTSWILNNECTIKSNTIKAECSYNSGLSFGEGLNEIKIQSVLVTKGVSPDAADENYYTTASAQYYCDKTPPQHRLVYNRIHTNDEIKGKLYLSDNFDTELTAFAGDPNVVLTRSETEANVFDVSIKENTDSIITAADWAGNSVEIPVTVTEIDRMAPTAEIKNVGTEAVGDPDRGGINAKAEILVKDVEPLSVKLALIPKAEVESALGKDGKIKEEYFDIGNSLMSDNWEQARGADEAFNYDGETDMLYRLTLSGVTGEYCIGLRSADSLGNEDDIVFDESPLTAKKAPIELMSYEVMPKEAGAKAILTAKFNVPVYVLPQNLITDTPDEELTVDETNYELARRQTGTRSQTVSFPIGELGAYKLYPLDSFGNAMLDENGNEIACEINVTDNDVKLNVKNGISVKLIQRMYDENNNKIDKDVTNEEWVSPHSYFGVLMLIAEPIDSNVLLSPVSNESGGFNLNTGESEKYFNEELNGYTKLIYDVWQLWDKNGFGEAEIYERTFTAKLFETQTPDAMWEECAVIDNIDNTNPKTNEKYSTILPTIGNVDVEAEMYDPQSGLDSVRIEYNGETYLTEDISLNDKDGNPIDYTEKPYTYDNEKFSLTIYSDTNPKSVKRMFITFKENAQMRVTPVSKTGAEGGAKEIPIRVENISKTPITENDVTISYFYKDSSGSWQTVGEDTYYKNAKAVIGFTDEYNERGLRIVNNGGEKERLLDSYENTFTFEIKDKYGYTYSAEAALTKFDNIPGTITYTIDGGTIKTNKPVTVKFYVEDKESGIGEFRLSGPDGDAAVNRVDENSYTAELSKGGIYTAVLYDNVGNKTEVSLTAPNIDTQTPKIKNISYNVEAEKKTSGIVTAALTYTKPNVNLTYVEATNGLTNADFNVDYRNSTIAFTKNGTVNVYFKDDYGNEGTDIVSVGQIYQVPPSVSAVAVLSDDERSVDVTFEKAQINGVDIDLERELTELTVSYGGITQRINKYDGDDLIEAKYTFYKNGTYTFRVYDDEGTASFVTLNISDIDTEAPKIEQITWSYNYYIDDNGQWTKLQGSETLIPGDEAGYIAASDKYNVTGEDVTVKITTDKPTKLMDSNGGYNTENEKVFNANGMFIFNMIKNNGLTASYGLDIEFIDKTPPVIELGAPEMIFFENENVGTKYSKELLAKPGEAFTAYDMFGGKTDLSDKVEIDYGKFNPDNLSANTFDRNIDYIITYKVRDKAGNITEAKRTVRLIGYNDAIVLVDGKLPDYAGRIELESGMFEIELKNFSGTSYAKLCEGVKTMGQMKTAQGVQLAETAPGSGKYRAEVKNGGWYTALVQTDKKDYFTVQIYIRRV